VNISFYIARRYLFSKKSKNVINIISLISTVVVAGVTASMVIVLSAFNGIESLVHDLFGSFDADVVVTPEKGRHFNINDYDREAILAIPGVLNLSEVLEEDVWVHFDQQNTVATLKGVETHFAQITTIDSMMFLGDFVLERNNFPLAVVGLGIYAELGARFRGAESDIITLNAPIKGKKLGRDKQAAFNSEPIALGGVYSVNAELDVKYVVTPISFARGLFGSDSICSSIEIDVDDSYDIHSIQSQIVPFLKGNTKVQTKYEKNALVYQTNESEKWATYLIMLFILVIAAFNIVASLTMLIIEKKRDIFILRSVGVSSGGINRIFILEGIMIYFIGTMLGLAIGIGACFVQQQLGIIELPGSMVPQYPVKTLFSDLLRILVSVMAVGMLFSFALVKMLVRRYVGG
jgi:lipoprotein-releasing system permease protein